MRNEMAHRNPFPHSLTTEAPQARSGSGAQPPSFLKRERVDKDRWHENIVRRWFSTCRWIDQTKFLSALVSLLFFLTNVLWAYVPETSFWNERRQNINQSTNARKDLASLPSPESAVKTLSLPLHSNALMKLGQSPLGTAAVDARLAQVPIRFGTLKDVFISPKKGMPLILLIQDVHLNREAQDNIAGVLEELALKGSSAPLVVGVEGAFGPFDFVPFRAFSSKEVGPKIREFLYQNKKIAAPSYVGLKVRDDSIRFIGIDSRKNYEANVAAFKESAGKKHDFITQLNELTAQLSNQSERSLNPEARDFNSIQGSFREEKIGLGQYLIYLKKIYEKGASSQARLESDLDGFSTDLVLELFLGAYELEKSMDVAQVEKERSRVIGELIPKLNGNELQELMALSMALKSGEVSFSDYYGAVRLLLERHQISLKAFPAFDKYVQYVLLSGGINSEKLFNALREFELAVFNVVAKSKEERLILERTNITHLLSRLAELGLTPAEWEDYKTLKAKHLSWMEKLPVDSFESFYISAETRSEKMIDTLFHVIASEPPNQGANQSKEFARNDTPVVLLAGGFHTPSMLGLIKKKNFSYAVLQPKISKVERDSGTEYLSIFSKEKTPLEKLFAGEKLFLAPAELELGSKSPESRAVEFGYKLMGVVGYQKSGLPIPPSSRVELTEKNGPDLFSDLDTGKSVGFDQQTQSKSAVSSPFGEIYLFPAKTSILFSIGSIWNEAKSIFQRFRGYAPIREIFSLPSVFFGLDFVFPGTVLTRIFFVLINAFIFSALFHDNTKDGKFSWGALAARTLGTFLIVAGSWGVIWYLGFLVPGESLIFSVFHQNLKGWLSGLSFLALSILGHALWNSAVRKEWQLSISVQGKGERQPVRTPVKSDLDEEDEKEQAKAFWELIRDEIDGISGRPSKTDGRVAAQGASTPREHKLEFIRAQKIVLSILPRFKGQGSKRVDRLVQLVGQQTFDEAQLKEIVSLIEQTLQFPAIKKIEVLKNGLMVLGKEAAYFIGYFENQRRQAPQPKVEDRPKPQPRPQPKAENQPKPQPKPEPKPERGPQKEIKEPKVSGPEKTGEGVQPLAPPEPGRKEKQGPRSSIEGENENENEDEEFWRLIEPEVMARRPSQAERNVVDQVARTSKWHKAEFIKARQIVLPILSRFKGQGSKRVDRLIQLLGQQKYSEAELKEIVLLIEQTSQFPAIKKIEVLINGLMILGKEAAYFIGYFEDQRQQAERKQVKADSGKAGTQPTGKVQSVRAAGLKTGQATDQTNPRAPPKIPWIHLAVVIVVYALLFLVVLPMISSFLSSLVPHVAFEGTGFTLLRAQISLMGSLAWLIKFTGEVVVILSGLVVVTRFVLRTEPGREFAQWVESRKSHLQQSYGGKLFVELIHTMYGFGFEKSDRLTLLYERSLEGKIEALDGKETTEERVFHYFSRLPVLQLVLLPFFATVGLLKNRIKLMIYSSLLSFGLLSLISGLAYVIVGPAASIAFLNWFLTFNILDPLRSGWIAPWMGGKGIGGALVGMFGLFGIINSFGLSLLLQIGTQTTEATKERLKSDFEKSFWRGWVRSVPIWIWLFFLNFLRNVFVPANLKKSAKSAFLPGGLHWVNLEIALLTSLSFGWLHDLIMKIESDQGVLGSGQVFVNSLFSPFGLSAGGFAVPFTGGMTQQDLMSFDPRSKLRLEEEIAKKVMEEGLKPGDLGVDPEKFKMPPPKVEPDKAEDARKEVVEAEIEVKGPYSWIPEAALVSKAKLDLWQTEMRIKAKEYAEKNGVPVLLPEVAVDDLGILIQTEVINWKVNLVYTDGTRQPKDEAQFDPKTGSFAPLPGKTFKFVELDLNSPQALIDSRGKVVKDLNGEAIAKEGFRPAPHMTGETVIWRDVNGNFSRIPPEKEFAVPIDPNTGFEVIFGVDSYARKSLEKAEQDLKVLRNRQSVVDELLKNPKGIAAVIVDPLTFEVKERIGDLNVLKNGKALHKELELWVIDESGQRVPFDPGKPDKRPDVITSKDGNGKEDLVLFPAKKEAEKLPARIDAQVSLQEALGTLSVGPHPNAGIEPLPVYMLVENPMGQKVAFRDIESAVRFMKTQRLGQTIEFITGGIPAYQDYVVNGFRLITNEAPIFKEKMMEAYLQTGMRGGFGVRVTYDPNTKELVGLAEIKTDPKVEKALQKELTDKQRHGQAAIKIVSGDNFEVYSISPKELQQFNMGRSAIVTDKGEWLVLLAYKNGEFYQKLTNQEFREVSAELYSKSGNDFFIKFNLAYKTKDGKVIATTTDPKDVQSLLKRSDLIFILNDGRRLPADKLPVNFESSGLRVVGMIDPRDNSTIKLGTEWQRMNYLIDGAIRREQVYREKGYRTRPAVPEVVFDGRPVSYHPIYEWELGNYLENLRMEAEREPNPALKQIKFNIFKRAAETRTYLHWNERRGTFEEVVVKGTLYQRVQQDRKERMDLMKARESEILKTSGKGGEIVVPYGRERIKLQAFREKLDGLAERWRETDAELRAARDAKNRAAKARIPDLHKEQLAIRKDAQKLLDETHQIEMLIQNKEKARLERLAKNTKNGAAIDPGKLSGVELNLFGPKNPVDNAFTAQRAYLETLRSRLVDPRVDAAEKEEIEMEIALAEEKNSFIDKDGNEHIIVTPIKKAEERAVKEEKYAHLDRQFLEIQEKLLKGEKTLIYWKFKSDDGRPVMETSFKDPDRYIADVRARINGMPDGKEKIVAQARLADLLRDRVIRSVDAQGEGFQIALIDGVMAKGGAVHTEIDPNKAGPDGISFKLVSLEEAQKVRRGKVEGWKEELAKLPPGANKDGLRHRIRDAENGVIVYTEGPRGNERVHKLNFFYGDPEVVKNIEAWREKIKLAVKQSEVEKEGALVVEYDKASKVSRMISDEKEVTERVAKLNEVRQSLEKKYQDLKQKKFFLIDLLMWRDPELVRVASDLNNAKRGIYEENGKTYVIKFGLKQAEENFSNTREQYDRSRSRLGRDALQYTLFDQLNEPIGSVQTNGEIYLTTISKIQPTDEKGLTLVKLETFAGRAPPTAVFKGELVGVTWDFINSNRQVVARGIGHIGSTEPLFVMINDFNGPLAGAGAPAQSQTYRFQKGLSLSEYPKHPELALDSSKALKRLNDGSLVIEQFTAHGKVSRDLLGTAGQVIETMEGIYRRDAKPGEDPFQVQRVIAHYYENPGLTMMGIPSRSVFRDPETGRILGWSRVLTSFDEFLKTRELKYERWDETAQEMAWEVKNTNGGLVKKYALTKVGDKYVPFNLTVFYYIHGSKDGYGQLGLADEAYTFVMDEKGLINGLVDPDKYEGDLRNLPYFEFTRVVKVEGQGPDTRIVYRVSVRDENNKIVLQFQEVKNPDGNLLEKYVIKESPDDKVFPSEVTFNIFDFGPDGYGKFKIANGSKTFALTIGRAQPGKLFDLADLGLKSGASVVCFDSNGNESRNLIVAEGSKFIERDGSSHPLRYLASLPKEGEVSRFVVRDEKGQIMYDFTLKEDSKIETVLRDGRLTYLRKLYAMWGERDGRYRRVAQALYRDTVLGGERIHSQNLETQEESFLTFDKRKWVAAGKSVDQAVHPTLENKNGKGLVLAEVSRQKAGIMKNPFRPDLPLQLLVAQKVDYKDADSKNLFDGRRLVNSTGETIVDVTEKRSDLGSAQHMVSVHLSDRDPLKFKMETIKPGANHVPVQFAQIQDGGNLINHDFVYFYVDARDLNYQGEFTVKAAFKDTTGNSPVTVSSDPKDKVSKLHFWHPVQGKNLKFKDSAGQDITAVEVIAESNHANKKFVFAVPVAALGRHIDVKNMAAEVGVTIESKGSANTLVAVSDVYRVGRGEGRIGVADLVEGDDSFVVPMENGGMALYDGTKSSDEGRAVEIRGPDSRRLGVLREFWTRHERSGVLIKDLRLILFDETGKYPLASVPVRRDAENAVVVDLENAGEILPYAVYERGNKVEVVSRHPINRENLIRSTFRKDALEPAVPEQTYEGDFASMPQIQGSQKQQKIFHRLYNAFLYLGGREDQNESEEIFRSNAAIGVVTPELQEELKESFARLTSHGTQGAVLDKVLQELESLENSGEAVAARVVKNVVPPLPWQRASSQSGVLWLITAGIGFLILAAYPIILHLYSYRWSKKVREYRKVTNLVKKKLLTRGFKYYTPGEEAHAMRRHADNVLKVNEHRMDILDPADGQPLYITSNEDIEGPFLQQMVTLYIQSYAGISREYEQAIRKINAAKISDEKKKELKEKQLNLMNLRLGRLDYFTRGVYKFLAVELARGNNKEGVSRYPEAGKFRPQIVGELERLLSYYREKMALGMVNDHLIARHESPLITENAELRDLSFMKAFNQMLLDLVKSKEQNGKPIALMDDRHEGPGFTKDKFLFNEETLESFLKAIQEDSVPPIYQFLGRYLFKLVPVFWGIFLLRGGDLVVAGIPGAGLIVGLIALGIGLSLVINSLVEARAIFNARGSHRLYGRLRIIIPIFVVFGIWHLLTNATLSFGATALLYLMFGIMLVEIMGILLPRFMILGGNRSFLGVSVYYHFRPPAYSSDRRANLIVTSVHVLFLIAAIFSGAFIVPTWFFHMFTVGATAKVISAGLSFVILLCLLHLGIYWLVKGFASLFFPIKEMGFDKDKSKEEKEKEGKKKEDAKKAAHIYIGGQKLASSIFRFKKGELMDREEALEKSVERFVSTLENRFQNSEPREAILDVFRGVSGDSRIDSNTRIKIRQWINQGNETELVNLFKKWLLELRRQEWEDQTTLWDFSQMYDPNVPDGLSLGQSLSVEAKARLEHAWEIQMALTQTGGNNLTGSSMDVAVNFVRLAITARQEGLSDRVMFLLLSNIYEKHSKNPLANEEDFSLTTENGQRIKLAQLLKYLSRDPGKNVGGVEAYVGHVVTVQSNKAAVFNFLFLVPDIFRRIGQYIVVDQNSTLFNTAAHWRDQRRMWSNPRLRGLIANRVAASRDQAVTETEFAAEGGSVMGYRGGVSITGTGWGNTVPNTFWDVLDGFSDPANDTVTFNPEFLEAVSRNTRDTLMNRLFGLQGNALTSSLISEDAATNEGIMRDAVYQYEGQPVLGLSEARWYRPRASRGDIEEQTKDKPRWVAGYFQMMNANTMQQAFDYGPHPYAVRELRAMEGDIWTLLPIVFILSFATPWLTIAGASPFVGKVLFLFVTGLVFNQMATLFAILNNTSRMGKLAGWGRWLSQRNQDFDIWSFRTVREFLAVITGLNNPSSKFDLSGGKSNPVPWQVIKGDFKSIGGEFKEVWGNWRGLGKEMSSAFRLKEGVFWNTVGIFKYPHNFAFTWLAGFILFVLNFVSIWWLDASSVFMMLLLLRFSAGAAFGVFVQARTRGHVIGRYGWGDAAMKGVGVLLSALAMVGTSWLLVFGAKQSLWVLGAFGFLLLVTAGIILKISFSVMNKFRDSGNVKWERAISVSGRAFWDFFMWFGWFIFVPMAPRFKFELIQGVAIIFTPMQFFVGFGVIIGLAFLVIFAGKVKGIGESKWISSRYLYFHGKLFQLQAELRRDPENVELAGHIALIQGLLMEVYENKNAGSWKSAKESLSNIQNIINENKLGVEEIAQPVQEFAMAGAMGFWKKLGIEKLAHIGWIEGGLTGLFGAGILSVIIPQGPPGSLVAIIQNLLPLKFSLLINLSPFWQMTAAGIIASAILIGILFIGHLLTGVALPSREKPVFGVKNSLRATRVAMIGLTSLPFAALGVITANLFAGAILIGTGILLGGYLHSKLNSGAADSQAFRIKEIIQMKREGATQISIQNEILPIISLGLEKFGNSGDMKARAFRQMANPVGLSKVLTDDEAAFTDIMGILNLALIDESVDLFANLKGWNESLKEASSVAAPERLALVPKGNSLESVREEVRLSIEKTRELRRLNPNIHIAVVLNTGQEKFKPRLVAEFAAVEFVTEGEMATSGNVVGFVKDKFLLTQGGAKTKLKVIVPAGAHVPAAFVEALNVLNQTDDFRNLIKVVILESVMSEGWIAEGEISLLNHLLEFRRLIGIQA